jgi:hypothetical protein
MKATRSLAEEVPVAVRHGHGRGRDREAVRSVSRRLFLRQRPGGPSATSTRRVLKSGLIPKALLRMTGVNVASGFDGRSDWRSKIRKARARRAIGRQLSDASSGSTIGWAAICGGTETCRLVHITRFDRARARVIRGAWRIASYKAKIEKRFEKILRQKAATPSPMRPRASLTFAGNLYSSGSPIRRRPRRRLRRAMK